MRQKLILTALVATIFANAQTSSDFIQAAKRSDVDIFFDVHDKGEEYRVAWGMDAAWDWDFNVNRGVAHIGKGNFATGRVSFQPMDLVKDNGDGTYTLTARQQKKLKWRCDLMKLTGTKQVNINCDHEALFYKVDANGNYVEGSNGKVLDYTGRDNYQGKPQEWYKLIKASVSYVQSQGLEVVSVSPFNEPDFVWEQATNESQAMKDFLAIAKLIRADEFFKDIRICGGNTLNDDRAMAWYNYLKPSLDEGNTHQLAGSFDNYANFFQQVKKDGLVATADELHNVGEAIVGVNYGMENGIWWGFDSKARGQFCLDSNEGVRLGYGENRKAWTCGAVYRNDATGEVHGYLGSSERQAVASSFTFVSTSQDVYFNGYGPTRLFTYNVPGGLTGSYQKGQINAERLFDITWGEDVAPFVVDGTYQLMNMSSKLFLTGQGSSNVIMSNRRSNGTSQHWQVAPGQTDGDISYWFVDNVTPSQDKHLNVLNQNLNNGATLICWSGAGDTHRHLLEEQWYVKYAQDGCFYIISRLSNKYLYHGSFSNGTTVTLNSAPTEQTRPSELKKYLWRFLPLDVKADTKAPLAPTNLKAKQRIASVELTWEAPVDESPLTYTVLRAEASPRSDVQPLFNTIGRNIAGTSFTDNTVLPDRQYFYKVRAVDNACNRSEDVPQNELVAGATQTKGLVAQWQFDNSLEDNTANRMNAATYGVASYDKGAAKSGSYALRMKGYSYVLLPYAVAQHDEMTIATWVRYSNTTAWQRIFDFGAGTEQYMFLTPTNGQEMRFVMKNGGEEQVLTHGKPLETNTWHHVAVSLKPSGEKVVATLWLDGVNVAQKDFSIKSSQIAPVLCYIGRSMFASDPLFDGYVDDFRIYNYALTADELVAVMEDTGEKSKDIDDSYEERLSTGIEAPKVQSRGSKGYYDTSGRRVSPAAKGVLIHEGKKVLVK